jgi:hypothetical protein
MLYSLHSLGWLVFCLPGPDLPSQFISYIPFPFPEWLATQKNACDFYLEKIVK